MKKLGFLFLFSVLLIGCKPTEEDRSNVIHDDMNEHSAELADSLMINKAIAVLSPTEGSKVKGTVTFTKDGNVIKVVADITGLKPGKHGFHIHEFGDISSPDGSSAGGHFAPHKKQHGAPIDQNRHEGDLGNIEADANGTAHYEWSDSVMTFEGLASIIGHAVVVHENADDLTSQPSGNAGGRLAYGVIGVAKD